MCYLCRLLTPTADSLKQKLKHSKTWQSKALYNYYEIPAVNPCLYFASLEQYNTILSLNSIPSSLLTPSLLSQIATPLRSHLSGHATLLFSHLSHLATSLQSHTFPIFLAHPSPTFAGSPPSQWQVDTSNIATFFH